MRDGMMSSSTTGWTVISCPSCTRIVRMNEAATEPGYKPSPARCPGCGFELESVAPREDSDAN